MVDCLPGSLKTLGLIPSTADKQAKNNKNKDGRKEGREKEDGEEGGTKPQAL